MAQAKRTKSARNTARVAATPEQTTPHENGMAQTPKAQPARRGFFNNAAVFLLSRLPWFRDRYYDWSTLRQTIIGLLLYLIVLPVIPIAIGVVMYLHDPEGFRRSKALPILGAIIVAWFGLFGLVAMQPPVEPPADDSSAGNESLTLPSDKRPAADDSDSAKQQKDAEQQQRDRAESEPTLGRNFKNCSAAFKAGVHDIPKDDESYRPELDADKDGYACER